MKKQWRAITGFPGYFANKNGEVLGKSGKVIKPWKSNGNGVEQVSLFKSGKEKKVPVARLILLTFVGPPPPGKPFALHGPAGRSCHRLDNLYWGDHKQNMIDKVRDGTDNRGQKCGQAKLTEIEVVRIRELLKKGKSKTKIAEQFGVSRNAIGHIGNGRTWKILKPR